MLVLYVGYRTPGVLAKAATTLDHLSGGRFEIGLGGGWHEWESRAYGYPFPPIGTRLDMLDEATQIIRGLLTQERTTFHGKHFQVENASCLPRPVQKRLPIWIGGLGEKRTLRLAARYGDGWNAAYVSPQQFKHLCTTLDQWCEKEGRDPASIERSVNVVFNLAPDKASEPRLRRELEQQWGFALARVEGGVLAGTPDTAAERVAEFVAAGAQGVNVALRAPWSAEALDGYVETTLPALPARVRRRRWRALSSPYGREDHHRQSASAPTGASASPRPRSASSSRARRPAASSSRARSASSASSSRAFAASTSSARA